MPIVLRFADAEKTKLAAVRFDGPLPDKALGLWLIRKAADGTLVESRHFDLPTPGIIFVPPWQLAPGEFLQAEWVLGERVSAPLVAG